MRVRIQVPTTGGVFGNHGHAATYVSEGWAQVGVKETYNRSKRDLGGGGRTRNALILRRGLKMTLTLVTVFYEPVRNKVSNPIFFRRCVHLFILTRL